MRIILRVTGTAVLRRAFEDSIDMAILAGHCRMFSIKMECEFGMVHLCILPAFGRVTRGTVGSELTVVMVIFLMAGDTFLGGCFQIMQVARSNMAFGTGYRRVFSNQIERHQIMVKA